MSNVAAAVLISASTLMNPTAPKELSFGASAYVTVNNQVRVSVEKNTNSSVVVLLRNKSNEVLYRQHIGKREARYAVKLDVSGLTDGQYELEISSGEGSIRKQLNVASQPIQQTNRTIALQHDCLAIGNEE